MVNVKNFRMKLILLIFFRFNMSKHPLHELPQGYIFERNPLIRFVRSSTEPLNVRVDV